MDMRTREWSLQEYFQMFFPSTYGVSVIETSQEPRQISLFVGNPEKQMTAIHSAPLTDFLDICSMAEIAASLRDQLKRPRLELVD